MDSNGVTVKFIEKKVAGKDGTFKTRKVLGTRFGALMRSEGKPKRLALAAEFARAAGKEQKAKVLAANACEQLRAIDYFHGYSEARRIAISFGLDSSREIEEYYVNIRLVGGRQGQQDAKKLMDGFDWNVEQRKSFLEQAYDRRMIEGRKLMEAGSYKEALEAFTNAADIVSVQLGSESEENKARIKSALTQAIVSSVAGSWWNGDNIVEFGDVCELTFLGNHREYGEKATLLKTEMDAAVDRGVGLILKSTDTGRIKQISLEKYEGQNIRQAIILRLGWSINGSAYEWQETYTRLNEQYKFSHEELDRLWCNVFYYSIFYGAKRSQIGNRYGSVTQLNDQVILEASKRAWKELMEKKSIGELINALSVAQEFELGEARMLDSAIALALKYGSGYKSTVLVEKHGQIMSRAIAVIEEAKSIREERIEAA